MQRFLLVRGVRGQLVANPHVDPSARRFVGKLPSAGPTWEGCKEVEEVVQDDPALRKAADPKRGGIVIVRECQAKDIQAARKELQPPAPQNAPPGGQAAAGPPAPTASPTVTTAAPPELPPPPAQTSRAPAHRKDT